jgi:hypothetical protein
MHFRLRPATQADGRKITIRQAVVNLTDWQTAMPEEKILQHSWKRVRVVRIDPS